MEMSIVQYKRGKKISNNNLFTQNISNNFKLNSYYLRPTSHFSHLRQKKKSNFDINY